MQFLISPAREQAPDVEDITFKQRLASILQAKFAVTGGVLVPPGDRLDYVVKPWALHNEARGGWSGHDGQQYRLKTVGTSLSTPT